MREKKICVDKTRIEKAIAARGISKKQMANDIDLSYSHLCTSINSGMITGSMLIKICNYLGVKQEVLTGKMKENIFDEDENIIVTPFFSRYQDVSTPKKSAQIFNDFVIMSAVDPAAFTDEEKNDLFKALIMTVRVFRNEIQGSNLQKREKRDLLRRLIATVLVFKLEKEGEVDKYI